ncbi:MAG: hypothetical protein WC238_01095 [Parcubacteria group bacterium]|jgi:hypothetical protein
MEQQKKLRQSIAYWTKISVIGIILGISLQFVGAWTEPGPNPPSGNLGAPINTSVNQQDKAGSLRVTGFRNFSATILDGSVTLGNILNCSGKLYTNSSGTVLCGVDASGSGSGDNLGNHIATQALNMNNNVITRQASGDFNTVELQSGSDRISFDNGSYNGETVFAALINGGAYPIQKRGSMNCPAGQAIRIIGVDGIATCVAAGAKATACPAGQKMTGLDASGNAICAAVAMTLTSCAWTGWEWNQTGNGSSGYGGASGAGTAPTYCPAGKVATGFDLDGRSDSNNESVFMRTYCCSMTFN